MPKERKNCLMCHMTINRKVHSPKNTKKNLYLIKKPTLCPKNTKQIKKITREEKKERKLITKKKGIKK